MMPEIATEGKLAQKLIKLEEAKKNGILTVEYQKVKKVICLENGDIRYATSNVKNEWFIGYLIRAGIIDKASTTSFMEEPAISEKAAHLLASAGLISEERAVVEAHNLISKIVTSCFRIQGKMLFSEGKADLRGKLTTIIKPRKIILDYYRQHCGILECKMIIGKEDRIPVFSGSAEQRVRGIELVNDEKNILKLIDGLSSVKAIEQIAPIPPEQTLKSLSILKILGIIETKDKPPLGQQNHAQSQQEEKPDMNVQQEVEETVETDEDREERKYYYELYEKHMRSNFFQLLGVNRHTDEDEIRKNYYALAKEIHPDRFQKESMKEIRPLMESLFARISEASSTLLDKEKRKKYEEEIFGEGESTLQSACDKMDKIALARGNYLKGKKLFEEGKYNEALKFLENAVAIDVTRWEYFLQLGLTQSKNPLMRTEAIKTFKKVIIMNPTSAEAYLELGILYKKCGRMNEAKYMLKCALQWEPDNAIAAFELKEVERGA